MSLTPPYSTSAISDGAALCVAGFRRAVMARRGEVPFILSQTLGSDARHAFEVLTDMALLLGVHSRRQLQLFRPCCCHLSTDELAVAGMVAAAGQSRYDEALARLNWLAGPSAHRPVLKAAATFSDILACHGHEIRIPGTQAQAPRRPAPLRLCTETEALPLRSGQTAHR